jgi:DNA-binding MarR family transcriptional regulator
MRHKDMYSQPGYLIRRIHQQSTAEFAAAVEGFNLTQVQLSILLAVIDHPGVDATRLSELIGSDRTTIGQALLLLEKRALIVREVGDHDRRTKRLAITPEGRRVTNTVAEEVGQVGDALLRGLDEAEQATLLALLTKLVRLHMGPDAVGEDSAATGL